MGHSNKPTQVLFLGGSELQQGQDKISARRVDRVAHLIAELTRDSNAAVMCGLKEQIGLDGEASAVEYSSRLGEVRQDVSRMLWSALRRYFSENRLWRQISCDDSNVLVDSEGRPQEIKRIDTIRDQVRDGWLHFCCFGGGVPVCDVDGDNEIYDIFSRRRVDHALSNSVVSEDFEDETFNLLLEGLNPDLVFVVREGLLVQDEQWLERFKKIDAMVVVGSIRGLENYLDGDSSEVTVIQS